jgi:RNA polymerase sigma-70 factor (ECF subfamily)
MCENAISLYCIVERQLSNFRQILAKGELMGPEYQKRNDLFMELFSCNYSRIMSFIYTLVPNASDAEDIMQETANVLWEKFVGYESGTNFVSWAITIAKYRVLSYRSRYNAKVSLNSHLIETLSEEAKTPQSGGHARLDALRHCIQQLNDKDRKLIQNRFEKRMTAKVLSQQIGVAMNTIYRNESRILALLMNCVSKALGVTG